MPDQQEKRHRTARHYTTYTGDWGVWIEPPAGPECWYREDGTRWRGDRRAAERLATKLNVESAARSEVGLRTVYTALPQYDGEL